MPEAVSNARKAFALSAEALEGVCEVHARYRQEQESILLTDPLVSTGRFHLRMDPACFVLDVEDPGRSRVRSDASTHTVWDLDAKRAEVYRFEHNPVASALIACITSDAKHLEKAFKIAEYCERDRIVQAQDESLEPQKRRSAVVLLEPKKASVREQLRSLTVELDLTSKLTHRIKYVNAEGESVMFELDEVELLRDVDPEDGYPFEFEFPEDVRVVERTVERDTE